MKKTDAGLSAVLRAERLEAENERLRKALRDLIALASLAPREKAP